MFTNFIKEYEKIRGTKFYVIRRKVDFKTVLEPNVTDLGFHYEILKTTTPEVIEYKVNSRTIKFILTEKIYFNKEDAEIAAFNMPIKCEKTPMKEPQRYTDKEWLYKQYGIGG